MTEQELRAWVRGTLSPEARRDVSRWLVRCTDPRLGQVLRGLVREWRQEQADAAAASVAPALAPILSRWQALLDSGRAAVVGLGLPGVVPAAVSRVSETADFRAERADDGTLTLRYELDAGTQVAILATSDAGDAVPVMPWTDLGPGAQVHPGWSPPTAWERPTVWWLRTAQHPPPSLADPLAVLARDDGSIDILAALRWEDLEA